jgi:hypothetical protein
MNDDLKKKFLNLSPSRASIGSRPRTEPLSLKKIYNCSARANLRALTNTSNYLSLLITYFLLSCCTSVITIFSISFYLPLLSLIFVLFLSFFFFFLFFFLF